MEDYKVREAAEPAAVIFIVGVIATFGLLATFAALMRIGAGFDADAILLLVMGMVVLLFGWRLFLFLWYPNLIVTGDLFRRRTVLGTVEVSLADIADMAVFTEVLKPYPLWTKLGLIRAKPPPVERFVIVELSGRSRRMTLPGFPGENSKLLDIMEKRTGKPVNQLPGPQALNAWLADPSQDQHC